MKREKVIAAAVKVNGKVFSLPPPARHNDAMREAEKEFPDHLVMPWEQGFVTDRRQFVGRREARRVAEAAFQLLPRASLGVDLYSEDLW